VGEGALWKGGSSLLEGGSIVEDGQKRTALPEAGGIKALEITIRLRPLRFAQCKTRSISDFKYYP
jgi:hypothetical protein